jgi:HIV-1 Vpr-binding protein
MLSRDLDLIYLFFQFLQHVIDENVTELLARVVNLRETRDSRLAFEGLRFLCAMFCHKKICMEWVQNGGVQVLLDVPRPSIAATAVSQCLYYIACDEHTMEKVCQLPHTVLQQMIQ